MEELKADPTHQMVIKNHLNVKADIENTMSAQALLSPDDIDRHFPPSEGPVHAQFAVRQSNMQAYRDALSASSKNEDVNLVVESRLSKLKAAMLALNNSAAACQMRLKFMTHATVERE